MAVTVAPITAASVSASRSVRLDPRYHFLCGLASSMIEALRDPIRFGRVADFSNGLNLPRVSYGIDDEEAIALYASVAAFPVYVLRRNACVPLRGDASGAIMGTRIDPETAMVRANEVLITRSRASAPGLAWPGEAAPADVPLIPAGFLIRASLAPAVLPMFVAAVLNHPTWRLLTAALAAGKSQDNISQEVLGNVPLPRVSSDTQLKIASRYRRTLQEISRIVDDEEDFVAMCDQVVGTALGLVSPTFQRQSVRLTHIALAEVGATRALRLDNRWHGPDNLLLRHELLGHDPIRLGELLPDLPTKGPQPRWVHEDEALPDTPRGVATASIQAGTIVADQTKPTTEASIARFPVVDGDLLVAMDGDGSLGKAAVYYGDVPTTVDSHIARCRTGTDTQLADTLACYLNSSWGRIQTAGLMTGATGQTQLSTTDLVEVLLPGDIVEKVPAVSTEYRAALRTYEPLARRARAILSRSSAELTSLLIADGAMESSDAVAPFETQDFLLEQLERIYPSSRR